MSRPTAVIVDVDGTLCDVRAIRHLVISKPKSFDAFHRAARDCPSNQQALDYVKDARAAGHWILILTGRMVTWHDPTRDWLLEHVEDFNAPDVRGPFMRTEGDYRLDVIVKREWFELLSKDYDIVGAIDDNPKIIALWELLGIPTTVVPGWHTEEEKLACPTSN